ncbi:uncharacterized protein [Coffea arabica]|uniref:BHLH domain-containing protein n=1 Tax=Coffea arabica TaxID=13443 RepID=A0A6P6TH30_COFAR|nr:transcription factor HEC3-like [Coffea arabica]
MDINPQKLTAWEPSMPVENHMAHHDHIFFETLWPNYVFENHQIPSSSSQHISTSAILSSGQIDHHHHDHPHQQMEEDQAEEDPEEELGAMKEMMFKIAAMQPVDIDPATIRKPKRRNVRISDDPQSVAARHRRERISEKIRILQRLVPGGTKMDTASMLDEAIRYVKFLKRQIRLLQANNPPPIGVPACPPLRTWSNNGLDPVTAPTATPISPIVGCNGNGDPMSFNNEVNSINTLTSYVARSSEFTSTEWKVKHIC